MRRWIKWHDLSAEGDYRMGQDKFCFESVAGGVVNDKVFDTVGLYLVFEKEAEK